MAVLNHGQVGCAHWLIPVLVGVNLISSSIVNQTLPIAAFPIESPSNASLGTVQGRLVFSVDLEDYFQVSAFESIVSRDRWSDYEWRADRSTHRLLDLLDETGARATFFVLGWLADHHPAIVREVAARGHEIASHSYWHRKVTTLSRDEFTSDAIRTRELLEQLTGRPVLGYRAPSFSITPSNAWAFDALVEAGYRYDSSVFPIRRRDYGFPGAPREPYRIATPAGPLDEYPLATRTLGPLILPSAGGGYLRHFPFGIIDSSVRQALREQRLAVYYIHPWEIDHEQPRLQTSAVTRWRHYGNLEKTADRLRRLLAGRGFRSFADLRLAGAL